MDITIEYLRHHRPLSFTSFNEFCIAPAKYYHYMTKPKDDPTDDLIIGDLVHTLSLEPAKINKFACAPKVDLRTTKGKEEMAKFIEDNPGKEVIKKDIYDKAVFMAESIRNYPFAVDLIDRPGTPERKWECDIFELPFVGYIDKRIEGAKLEIKTVQDASKSLIERDFFYKGYPIQFGLYDIADPTPENYYICVEKTAPFIVNVFSVEKNYLNYGKTVITHKAEDFKQCLRNGIFTAGYEAWNGGEIDTIDIPRWVR